MTTPTLVVSTGYDVENVSISDVIPLYENPWSTKSSLLLPVPNVGGKQSNVQSLLIMTADTGVVLDDVITSFDVVTALSDKILPFMVTLTNNVVGPWVTMLPAKVLTVLSDVACAAVDGTQNILSAFAPSSVTTELVTVLIAPFILKM